MDTSEAIEVIDMGSLLEQEDVNMSLVLLEELELLAVVEESTCSVENGMV